MSRVAALVLWLAGGVSTVLAEPRWDFSGESVRASDVDLIQLASSWRWEVPARALRGELSLARNDLTIDYRPVPFDFRGKELRRSEHSEALQTNVRWRSAETLEWIGTAGAYQGFTNYRSLWLAEYFRQQYEPLGMTAIDRWEAPDPRGVSAGAGVRWEYLRASGFLEFTAALGRDEVAPGYEIDFDGLRRGRVGLNTAAFTLSTENVVSPSVRSRIVLRASRVSERSWRFGGEAALNWAVGERLVLRGVLGGATEDPRFHAWFGGLTVDWALTDQWAWFVQGRYYTDTGEIEDALLFTSAAPGLHSRRWATGVRWQGERWALRLQAGELRSDHDPTNPRLDFFQNLYRDRVWTLIQVAASVTY